MTDYTDAVGKIAALRQKVDEQTEVIELLHDRLNVQGQNIVLLTEIGETLAGVVDRHDAQIKALRAVIES